MNAPSPRPLPASWADRLFERMQGMYGSLWVDRWRTGELDENGRDRGLLNAKLTWCADLGGFVEQPERITRALEACRHRALPPTLPEFLDLCRQAQVTPQAALPAPKITPEVAQARAEEVASVAKTIARKSAGHDHRAWARRIVADPKAFPSANVKLAREALDAMPSS